MENKENKRFIALESINGSKHYRLYKKDVDQTIDCNGEKRWSILGYAKNKQEANELIGTFQPVFAVDYIHTVTTLKTIYPYKNPAHSYYTGARTIGWFPSLDGAKETVLENMCDIYEDGYYPFAIVESFGPGPYSYDTTPIWYQWKGDIESGGYVEIPTPKEYKQMCGFAFS